MMLDDWLFRLAYRNILSPLAVIWDFQHDFDHAVFYGFNTPEYCLMQEKCHDILQWDDYRVLSRFR